MDIEIYETVEFGRTEFEADRVPIDLEFTPKSLQDAILEKDVDDVSRFLSRSQLRLIVLLMSNFVFCPGDIKTRIYGLADSLGCLDQKSGERLDEGIMFANAEYREACATNSFDRTKGIAVYAGGKRLTKRPVYWLKNGNVLLHALIATELIKNYSSQIEIPGNTPQAGFVPFSRQVMVLDKLYRDNCASTLDLYQLLSVVDRDPSMHISQIFRPLLNAGFIKVEGEKFTIQKEKLKTHLEQTPLRGFLSELMGTQDTLTLPYIDLVTFLFDRYCAYDQTLGAREIQIKITKFIEYLKEHDKVIVEKVWQGSRDEKYFGKSGISTNYRITEEGVQFISRLKLMFENPRAYFGDISQYFCFRNNGLAPFQTLPENYRSMILTALQTIF